MGKGIGHVYKHIQQNCPCPYTKHTFVVPPHVLFTSQHDSTNDYGVTVIYHKQPSPMSKLTTTMKVDTDRNNDDDIMSSETPRKHNNNTPEIPETTTTTKLVQEIVNSSLF